MEKILRHETLFGKQVSILDASHITKERIADDIKIFKISEILKSDSLFIGFGKPNVYLGLPDSEKYSKFDAKSFKRKDSEIINTKGWIQSGLIINIEELTQEMKDRINISAKSFVGTRSITCVNANARVLNRAGFTTGGEDFTDFYLPMTLAKHILKHGIEYNGEKLKTTIIKTTPNYLENFGLSVLKSQWLTFYRHGKKYFNKISKKNKFIQEIKKIKNKLFKKNNKKNKIEEFVVNFKSDIEDSQLKKIELTVTNPSKIGLYGRYLWGPHSFFEIKVDPKLIDKHLPNRLKEYSGKKATLYTWIKKNILFSKPVVNFIRKNLTSEKILYPNSTEKDLFNMIRTSTENITNKYNIVITSESIHIIKLNIKYKYVDWILSKHVLLSGYSDDVRYAGEFWKDKNGNIYFNNNSGTYMPNKEIIEDANNIFKNIFPNIKIYFLNI